MTSSISSPFGVASTALEVVEGVDLHGRRALVTGRRAGSASRPPARSPRRARRRSSPRATSTAAERVAADIRATTGNPAVSVAHLDLLDRGSIDRLVASVPGPLHLLVNNAGVMAVPQRRAQPGGPRAAVRHEPPRALPPHASACSPRCGLPAERGSCRSAPGPTRTPRSSSTTSTSNAAPTTRRSPTRSRRPPTCSSPWRPPGGGPTTASSPTPCTPARSPTRTCRATTPRASRRDPPARAATPGRPWSRAPPPACSWPRRPLLDGVGGPLLRGLPGGGGRRSGSGRPGRHRRRAARPRPRRGREAVGDLRADDAVITRPGVFAEVAHSSQRRSRRRGCRALCEDARSRGLTTVAGARDRPYVAMARINGPGSGASALPWNTTLVAPASPRSRTAFATTSASSSASTLTGGSMYTTT